jgi:hypothetical protein
MRQLAAILGLLLAVGCGASGGGGARLALGAPTPSTPAGATGTALLVVDSIDVAPPAWLELSDDPALAVGLDAYVRDASAALGGFLPAPGDAQDFPLTVVLHDVVGCNFWDPSTRTAWLE